MKKRPILGLLSAAIIFTLMISLGASMPTQTLTDEKLYSESRRQLIFRFVLSEDAQECANQIIEDINDEIYPAVLVPSTFAYLVLSDASMARDSSGENIGDGLSHRVTLYLLVWDSARDGSTMLNLASFNTNPDLIQYFVEIGLVNPSVLASQVEMKCEIEYEEDTVLVRDDWDAFGYYGEIELSMEFTRQDPSYVPENDYNGHYLDNYIGMRYRYAPDRLLSLSKRATTYTVNLQSVNISFDLEDSELSAIFSDEGNIINQVREEQSEILLEEFI